MAKGKKFDTNTPIGMAGGIYAAGQLKTNEQVPAFIQDLDPRMLAAGMVFAGDWLPKQKFMQNFIKNNDMRAGIGYGLQAVGIQDAMEEFGISGIGQSRSLRDDDILAVAIEGDYDDDDLDVVNDDVLADDDWQDDDLDVINDDVLADDDYDDDDDDDDEDEDMWY